MVKFIDDYEKYAMKLTDAPIHYHRFVCYSIIGAGLKNKIFFKFGDLKIYPNLWIILLAPSSTFRKSTTINIGIRILNKACPSLIYPSEFSHEKILELLKDQPQGIFVFYEFLSLMGLLNRDYMSGTKALLTELWDSPEYYERKTKGISVLIEEPVISILSATTMQWFLEKVKETDLLGGFLPRFLFIPAKEKTIDLALPPAVDDEEKNNLINELSSILTSIPQQTQMTLSDEAEKLYKEWYIKYNTELSKDSRMSSLLIRSNIYLLKLAMIIEISNDGGNVIKAESMQEAINNINWIIKSMGNLMEAEISFSKFEAQEKKIIKIIRENEGITRNNILRKSHLPSNFLNQIMQTLIESGSIESKSGKENSDDKPTTRYYTKLT